MGRHGLVVVIVEDEPDLCDLICEALGDEGYEVTGISEPQRALHLDRLPALFLLDLMLPGMSGIELARQLRTTKFATVPIIAMSASGSMLRQARESGLFNTVLPKPFDLDSLFKGVEFYAGNAT